MPLTESEKAAIIAAVTAAVDGVPAPQTAPVPWWRQSVGGPFPPLAMDNAPESFMRYASQGLRANGTQAVAPHDLERFRMIADRLAAATSPQEADAILPGAGHFSPDVAIYLVMTGAVQGLGAFQTPSIFAPWGAWDSIPAAAAWELGVVTPDTPGAGT